MLAAALVLLASDLSLYWHLPIMIVLVNLVYSASRYDDLRQIASHAARGILYIVIFLGGVLLLLLGLHHVLARWM
ncbi:MAG TPA: hypothetical protein PKD86_06300 [Gemmatales bacterium]|nr:hypothetical protein [Gemmatales bacterium]HMP58947.1 hypothetical protein [Gemmatales bacterium]